MKGREMATHTITNPDTHAPIRGLTPILLVLFAATIGVSQVSCVPGPCTAIGWQEGLTFSVRAPGDAYLGDGAWKIAIVADGHPMEVTFHASNGHIDCDQNEPQACATLLFLDDESYLRLQVDPVIESRSQRLVNIGVNVNYGLLGGGGPASVELAISRNDGPPQRTIVQPEYNVREPNGDGCGVATTARQELIFLAAGDHQTADSPGVVARVQQPRALATTSMAP